MRLHPLVYKYIVLPWAKKYHMYAVVTSLLPRKCFILVMWVNLGGGAGFNFILRTKELDLAVLNPEFVVIN